MPTVDPMRRRLPPAVLFRRVAMLAATPEHVSADGDARAARAAIADDPALVRACRGVAHIEQRKLALLTGPQSIADDDARDSELTRLDRARHPDLEQVVRCVPRSWHGHRLRAATFQLVDAGALYAQVRSASLIDRLLLAIIHDLAAS